MAQVDPTRFHVHADRGPLHTHDASFQELMAEQLRHAPWVAISLVLHAVVLLALYLMPTPKPVEQGPVLAMQPQIEPIQLPDEVPPEPLPKPEVVDQPVIMEPDIVETPTETPTDEPFTDSPTKDSAFTSTDWNAAVGMSGGAGGPKYAGRSGGGKKGGRPGVPVTIDRALHWLADHQDEDGHWDADEFMKHDTNGTPCDGPGNPVHDVGLTGLALLAFLGDGHTMRGGTYKDVVKRGVLWLREQQDDKTGLFGTPNSNEFIYDHAIAAVAMVEAYGLSDYKLLRNNAQRGIDYLEYHRNPYLVWRYQPRDGDNDISVTGWCLMAYASARYFDLEVNTTALELCRTWFDQMTDPVSGRTGYLDRGGLSSRRTGEHTTRFPREKGECMTSVSLLSRIFLGDDPKQDKTMRAQADLIGKKKPVWNPTDGSIDHYAWYYGTYALFQMGGHWWANWEQALDAAVVKTQRRDANFDGSWDPIGVWGQDGGRVYSTALLCLTLEAYYRYSRLVH